MGKRITHLGPSGSGQLGKAANQILVGRQPDGGLRGPGLREEGRPAAPALHEALTAGAANSWALEVLGRKMIDRDFKPAFAVKHQQKDLAIVLKTSREKKLPLPGMALVHQLLTALEAEGRGDDGTQALYTLYERLGGEGNRDNARLSTERAGNGNGNRELSSRPFPSFTILDGSIDRAASWGSPPPISSSCASPA